jgi:protein-L-isoaspartate(D-aspartate) O-methyltransferase
VYTIEIIPALAQTAKHLLHELGYSNVHVIEGDGALGWPCEAPFDGIVVAAGTPSVPDAWLEQLADGGRLILPMGERYAQRLIRVERTGGEVAVQDLGGCVFVPLLGPRSEDAVGLPLTI